MTAALEARMAREAERVRTDAQALTDVRTLDEWAAENPENPFATTRGDGHDVDEEVA